MSTAKDKRAARVRRHRRVRKRIEGTATRPRLAVFRSNRHISAQLIDDRAGHTLAAASSLEAETEASSATVAVAEAVGERLAARATAAGIEAAVFDRGGFRYHGQVAALATGARNAGLDF